MPKAIHNSNGSHRTMQVVNHVRALIENGTLQPGDKIPPEREFARTLKISRASLRTGIGYLAAMGVMKIRHGVETFVADGPPDIGKASLGFISALHGFQSWQMFEARIILESNLAALAAERGKEEHHAPLAEEVAEMFASLNAPAEYLVHDVLFHRIIAQASGNPILAAIMETVTSSLPSSKSARQRGHRRERRVLARGGAVRLWLGTDRKHSGSAQDSARRHSGRGAHTSVRLGYWLCN